MWKNALEDATTICVSIVVTKNTTCMIVPPIWENSSA